MPQSVCEGDEAKQISVLASEWDWSFLKRIEINSHSLGELSEHARGDEINAEGHLWRCGNCMAYNVPGEKKKGGGYKDKLCLACGARLTPRDAVLETLISDTNHFPYTVPYIDGRGLIHRYDAPPRRFLRKDFSPLFPKLKRDDLYTGPKVLIRQAVSGLSLRLLMTHLDAHKACTFIE